MESAEQLVLLAREGDREASDRLVRENSGLIWSVARRFFGRGIDPDDLYQLGAVGFVKAAIAFDASMGTRFSTYAVPKIAGEIKRFLRDDGIIKVSRTLKENSQRIWNACERFESAHGREPHISEISELTGLSPEEIAEASAAPRDTMSLDGGPEDGLKLEDIVGGGCAEEGIVENLTLMQAIRSLPEKEKTVIDLRYFRDLTQQQTAAVLGTSQVQVSRTERRAVEKLRIYMNDNNV